MPQPRSCWNGTEQTGSRCPCRQSIVRVRDEVLDDLKIASASAGRRGLRQLFGAEGTPSRSTALGFIQTNSITGVPEPTTSSCWLFLSGEFLRLCSRADCAPACGNIAVQYLNMEPPHRTYEDIEAR